MSRALERRRVSFSRARRWVRGGTRSTRAIERATPTVRRADSARWRSSAREAALALRALSSLFVCERRALAMAVASESFATEGAAASSARSRAISASLAAISASLVATTSRCHAAMASTRLAPARSARSRAISASLPLTTSPWARSISVIRASSSRSGLSDRRIASCFDTRYCSSRRRVRRTHWSGDFLLAISAFFSRTARSLYIF